MNENNLFASVVLFRELYDNDRDIYDVISEFIKAALAYKRKWVFNATEITKILEETFDFKIPEAVVKTTIRNRLLREGVIKLSSGLYTVNTDKIDTKKYIIDFENNQSIFSTILSALFQFIEQKNNKVLTEKEKETVSQSFNSFLTDNSISEQYSSLISSYIIENQTNSEFKDKINAIKEGLVLYNGIRYTSNLNELGSWNSNLVIYLDTEHLFNSAGLNGVLFKELFEDFLKLIKEINRESKAKTAKNIIDLKYFVENRDEVEHFFFVAECIIQNKASLDPSKTAMLSIIDGCSTKSDVLKKKSSFFDHLKDNNIICDDREFGNNPKFNLEDLDLVDLLISKSAENKRVLDPDECMHYLKLFTKINTLRKGVNDIGFERIGYILMSGKSAAHFIAHSNETKFKEGDIPFASDIDFITNKFWFKLKKGLSNKSSVPKSFDIVTKAQIVLSSQINSTIAEKYNDMRERYKKGLITKNETISYHHELRDNVRKPEEIVPANLDESLIFISTEGFESFKREKSNLESKVKEGERAVAELRKIKFAETVAKRAPLKIKTRIVYSFLMGVTYLTTIAIIILIAFWIKKMISPSDTPLSIVGFVLTIIIELYALFKKFKLLKSRIQILSTHMYKRRIFNRHYK